MEVESASHRNSTCSRCLPIETNVTPLAWTLSTLGQTNHEVVKETRSHGEVSIDLTDTTDLLKQYRILQVSLYFPK